MNKEQKVNAIINRINQEGITKSTKEEFDKWYTGFDDASTIVTSEGDAHTLKDEIWAKIHTPSRPKAVIRQLYYRIAAVAAVLLCIGLSAYMLVFRSHTATQLSAGLTLEYNGIKESQSSTLADFLDSTKYISIPTDKLHEDLRIITQKGEWTKIQLPDGTKVSVNAGTILTLNKGFGEQGSRVVELIGEAYFDVAKVKNSSFIVKTDKETIEVLGTQFNVKAYANQRVNITSLYEGQIRLSRRNQEILMTPNQMLVNDGDVMSTMEIVSKDLSQTADWRSMRFSFEEEPLQDVLDQLAIWYDLEVTYVSAVPNQNISGKMAPNMALEEMLDVLRNLTGGDLVLSGNTLSVNFNKRK